MTTAASHFSHFISVHSSTSSLRGFVCYVIRDAIVWSSGACRGRGPATAAREPSGRRPEMCQAGPQLLCNAPMKSGTLLHHLAQRCRWMLLLARYCSSVSPANLLLQSSRCQPSVDDSAACRRCYLVPRRGGLLNTALAASRASFALLLLAARHSLRKHDVWCRREGASSSCAQRALVRLEAFGLVYCSVSVPQGLW